MASPLLPASLIKALSVQCSPPRESVVSPSGNNALQWTGHPCASPIRLQNWAYKLVWQLRCSCKFAGMWRGDCTTRSRTLASCRHMCRRWRTLRPSGTPFMGGGWWRSLEMALSCPGTEKDQTYAICTVISFLEEKQFILVLKAIPMVFIVSIQEDALSSQFKSC